MSFKYKLLKYYFVFLGKFHLLSIHEAFCVLTEMLLLLNTLKSFLV